MDCGGGSTSRPLPFEEVKRWDILPFVMGGGVDGRFGGEVGNGRVSRRSAREY